MIVFELTKTYGRKIGVENRIHICSQTSANPCCHEVILYVLFPLRKEMMEKKDRIRPVAYDGATPQYTLYNTNEFSARPYPYYITFRVQISVLPRTVT